VLDVDLVAGLARPGEGQAGEQARLLHGGELVLVEEVGVLALMAEEEPVAAARADGLPLAQEGAEGRNAGAGPDHHDRRRGIGRQGEAVRLLHVEPHRAARLYALGEEGRGDPETPALVD